MFFSRIVFKKEKFYAYHRASYGLSQPCQPVYAAVAAW
jgi:hypothetical protein